SARTVSCWMRAEGSDTRRTGPLAQAPTSATTSTAAIQRPQVLPAMPHAPVEWKPEDTTANGARCPGPKNRKPRSADALQGFRPCHHIHGGRGGNRTPDAGIFNPRHTSTAGYGDLLIPLEYHEHVSHHLRKSTWVYG